MKSSLCVLLLLVLGHASTAHAQEAPAETAPETTKQEAAKPEEEETPTDKIVIGLDYYYGRTNLPGQRRISDGFWIGSGPVYPASAYLSATRRDGTEAKVAYGTGNLYRGSASTLKQPFEACVKKPAGGDTKLTLGKYYVPFALQEWQFETKWGGMIEKSVNDFDLAASLNYDQVAHHSNLYLRAARNLSDNLSIGASAGFGRGLSFGSPHDRAFGLDLTGRWRGFRLLSEYVELRDRANGNFHFAHARIDYEKWNRLRPFAGRFSWNDRSGFFGQFNSTVFGATIKATPSLSFEIATAKTSNQRVNWIQLHWNPEWQIAGNANAE